MDCNQGAYFWGSISESQHASFRDTDSKTYTDTHRYQIIRYGKFH